MRMHITGYIQRKVFGSGQGKEYLLSSEIKIPDEGYETFMHASVVAGMAIAHTGTSITRIKLSGHI